METKSFIPEFSLLEIVKSEVNNQEKMELDYFVVSFSSPMQLSKFPHSASYFGIAVCTNGSANLFANLTTLYFGYTDVDAQKELWGRRFLFLNKKERTVKKTLK